MLKNMCLVLLIAGLCAWNAEQTHAARLVKIRVFIGNEVILEGSTSDDGTPDADTTWNYLLNAQLKQTEKFQSAVDQMTETETGVALKASGKITVSYGGRKEFTIISLRRSINEQGETQWRVEPELVEKWFDSRMISRREAAALDNPKLK